MTLKKQSVETWDLFWDAFRRDRKWNTWYRTIDRAVVILKSRPDVISNFYPSKKNSDKPCESVQLLRFPVFPGKPEKPSKHEFEQANISLAQRELY